MVVRRLLITSVMTAVLTLAPVSFLAVTASAAPAAGNTIAVCGCGKVFTPNADTDYITHEGVRYACCSEGCHKMASESPAKAAKMAQVKTKEAIAGAQTPVHVANVIEVTKDGAVAMCGCGMKVAVNDKTVYLDAGDKAFATCSSGCRDHLASDVAKAAKMIDAKMVEHRHGH